MDIDGRIGTVPEPGDGFERLLAGISARFISLPAEEIDAHVEALLQHVAEFFGFDRAAVMQGAGRPGTHRMSHRWFRPGLEPHELVGAIELPWFERKLSAREVFFYADLADLPDEARHERDYVRRHGHRSSICFPLVVADDLLGSLSFSTVRERREWTPAIVARIRLVADVVAGALERKRTELELRRALAEAEELRRRLEDENLYLRQEVGEGHGYSEIVGRSTALRAVLHQVDQVAPTDAPVLLTGETGTGKELVARAIHSRSGRAGRPLIAMNCAALPATLVESELFGHEKGAFTGALQSRPGRFELADGGTLFLDEIGDLEGAVQAKLLRVLQDGEVQRVGGTRSKRVDVRIVAATNRNLAQAIREGRFRSDLYYRLSVFPIELPPLRARREDIPLLVWYFVQARQKRLDRRVERVTAETMARLVAYDWPGNVRELENVVERALILSAGEVLDVRDPLAAADPPAAAGRPAEAAAAADGRAVDSLADNERQHLRAVLDRCGWRIEGPGNAADRLGLRPSTLRNRMRRLGLSRPPAP